MFKRLPLVVLLFAGCAEHALKPSAPQAPVEYIDLFMRRASASEVEFEQYKISPGGIFLECGEFVRGRPAPEDQKFIPSDSVDLSEVREKAATVKRLIDESPGGLPTPGKGDSMFDPGQFLVSIGQGSSNIDLKTTINAVSDAADPAARALKSLAVAVRRALKTEDCGKNDFYGIPGSS